MIRTRNNLRVMVDQLEASRRAVDAAAVVEAASQRTIATGNEALQTLRDQWQKERNGLRAEVEQLSYAVEHELGPHCSSCGNAIDPDCCWCGADEKQHRNEEHGFVPMGCDCSRDPRDRDWMQTASALRENLWQAQQTINLMRPVVDAALGSYGSQRGGHFGQPQPTNAMLELADAIDVYRRSKP
jgi:hypothetical protein